MENTTQAQPVKKKSLLWLWLILGLLAFCFLARCMATVRDVQEKNDVEDDIEVLDGTYEKIGSLGAVLVEGSVKNNSTDNTYKFVQVRVTVYDKDGNQIGTDTSYIDSDTLPPKATSTYTVYVDCDLSRVNRVKTTIDE